MLIGSISALGIVCWDLSFPFNVAVDQLKTIRDMIKATMQKDEQNARTNK
jgi:hypothetical protein